MNVAAKVEGIYPLSASQQGMWVQSVAHPDGLTFVEQSACCLTGDLNAHCFRQAWQMVMDRHAALRSAFVAKGDTPLQLVIERAVLPLREVACHPDEEAVQLEHLLVSEREAGFVLNRPPLVRSALLRIGAKRHWWVISFHHLILDGWSLAILWREVRTIYVALITGQRPVLSLAPDYRKYVAWLKSRTPDADSDYWRERLSGFNAATPIVDRDGNGGDEQPYRELTRQTGAVAGLALSETTRRCRLPAAVVLEAVWAILLAGRSGLDDVVFGTTVSGRPPELADATDLVGCFINTVPVRLTLQRNMTLLQNLQAHHEARATQAEHEYCAAGQIRAWSVLPLGQPLYHSLLVVENLPSAGSEREAGDDRLRVSEQRVCGGRSSLPLSLVISPGTSPHLRLIFQPQWLSATSVDGLARDLERLLDELPDQLDKPLGELLSSIERGPMAAASQQITVRRSRSPYVAPRTRLEHALCRIWEELFGLRDIGMLDDFFALGGHSLMVLQMASRIRDELGFDCPLHTIIGASTIERLAAVLVDQEVGSSALIPLASGGDGRAVYCPHPLGGHVLCYAPLARGLAGRYPCWGLQAPGLNEGESLAASWDELIAHHWQLLPAGDSPLILFGYSYGGYIAMELAERLRQAGRHVPEVVLLDVPHPSVIPEAMSSPDRATLVHSLFGRALDLDLEAIRALPAGDLLPRVHELAIARHVLPPGAPLAMLERLLDVAHNASRLSPPLRSYDFPALLLRARDGAERITDRDDLGWRDHVSELRIAWVDGDHESMLEAPHIPALLEALSGVLS